MHMHESNQFLVPAGRSWQSASQDPFAYWCCILVLLQLKCHFHWLNPSGQTMALESTQPLAEMSNRNNSWGLKVAGADGWQNFHLNVPIVSTCVSLNFLENSGPVKGLFRDCFTFDFTIKMPHWTMPYYCRIFPSISPCPLVALS